MPFINLGIVAHVDAGKTSLTERLLYAAGVIDSLGSVDAGTTRTDSLDLERRRGITIRAAVTTFPLGNDLIVNLLDTPGHPDFVAEVERSLTVLDAAVLVLSAVEGVQPQTVVIWRALRRLGVPTLLHVNKVDRGGADVARTVEQIRRRLTTAVVPLTTATTVGRRDATVHLVSVTDERIVEAVAAVDDPVLRRWLDGRPPAGGEVRRALRRAVGDNTLFPLTCGSAITGAGTAELQDAIGSLLPTAAEVAGPATGTVFAVDRDERGRRVWVRMWGGTLRLRDRVALGGRRAAAVTELAVSAAGGPRQASAATAGSIAVVRGPAARIGDTIGAPPRRIHHFPPPVLQALVEPEDAHRRSALFTALTELADEDPLIDLRIDDAAGEAALSLHGEVQKETIASLLAERFGVTARFRDTTVVCVERVVGTARAEDRVGERGNPYLAGIGLAIEPAADGVHFSPGIERGRLPAAFVAATEEGVRTALHHGLHSWAVTGCLVTMTSSQYWPRQSAAHQRFDKSISSIGADFRLLAQVVVMAALVRAGTEVCEPIEHFELDVPDEAYPALAALLGRIGGVVLASMPGTGYLHVEGHVPAASVAELAGRLPDLTSGEGVLVTRPDHDRRVVGRTPARSRRGIDPRDRAGWFREMKR